MSSDSPLQEAVLPIRALVTLVLVACCCALHPAAARAEVQIFRLEDREEALQGETDGVAVGPLGELRLAPDSERVAGLEQPFVFTAGAVEGGSFGSGWILGTGNDGKIVHVGRDGSAEVLAATEEPTIFAVLGTRAGEILVAGSPGGAVSRLVAADDGNVLEPLMDPDATYVWGLAEDDRGRLLVATGLPGRLLRFDRSGQEVEILWESPDDHVRSLWVHSDGSVWAGTAGQGRIVRVDGDSGEVRTVFDASHPEVLAFAEASDGAVYAALLASEASFVDLTDEENGESATPSGEVAAGSRTAGFEGSRSAVVRFDAGGGSEDVATLEDETIHSLLWHDGDLWIGTGQDGALYRLRDEILVREVELDDRQIVGMARLGDTVGLATTNGAAVYRLGARPAGEGTFTSRVLDAGARSRFGVFRWRGDAGGGALDVSFRLGASSEPDATWSEWRSVARDLAPGEDAALTRDAADTGRYAQWRTTLRRGDGDGPRLIVAELSYRQENRAPEIQAFQAMAPGKILVEQSFNPTSTVFEPWSPNRQGIFTTLDAERKGDANQKELWKHGWRTLLWKAEDANDDELRYALHFRRQVEAGESDGPWLPMAEDLEASYYSFDARVLPDGVYRFRLVVDDASDRTDEEAARSEKVSEPVIVDHTPPRIVSSSAEGEGGESRAVLVRLHDDASPIRAASVSVDAGAWRELRPVDGLLDGHQEALRLEVPAKAHTVLLRVMDASFNVVTFDLSSR